MAALRLSTHTQQLLLITGVSYTALPAFDTQDYRRIVHGATGVPYTEAQPFTGVSYTRRGRKCLTQFSNSAAKCTKNSSSKNNNYVADFGFAGGEEQ